MPAPTTTYTWDTNQTNAVQPSAGILSDGVSASDIVNSSYTNYQFNSIGQWIEYHDTLLAAINNLSSTTDITMDIDSDNNGTTNKVLITHNGGTELARLDEDSNLKLTDASGHTITIGNDAITNANADGTLTVSSQKHVTIDIDSDNDGVDGVFKVRANGANDALTVTEAGLVTATGNLIGANLGATDIVDIQTAIKAKTAADIANSLNFTVFTDVDALTFSAASLARITVIPASTVGGNSYALTTTAAADAIVVATATGGLFGAGLSFADGGVNSACVSYDGSTYAVAVGSAGNLYTSVSPWSAWTARTSGTANALGDVVYGNGYWVTVGSGANNTIRYNTTDPTTAWSASTSGLDGTTTFLGVDYGSTYFVALTSDDEIIYTTNPSSTWTLAAGTPALTTQTRVTFCGDRWFVYGQGGTLVSATTPTGTWTDYTNAAFGDIQGVVGIPIGLGSYMYLMNSNGGISFAYSTNGTTWTPVPFFSANVAITATTQRFFHYDSSSKRLFLVNMNGDLMFSDAVKAAS